MSVESSSARVARVSGSGHLVRSDTLPVIQTNSDFRQVDNVPSHRRSFCLTVICIMPHFNTELISGAFAKLRKATISVVISVLFYLEFKNQPIHKSQYIIYTSLFYSSDMFRCSHHHQTGAHNIIIQNTILKCDAGTDPKNLAIYLIVFSR
jgi:hypothetical protein